VLRLCLFHPRSASNLHEEKRYVTRFTFGRFLTDNDVSPQTIAATRYKALRPKTTFGMVFLHSVSIKPLLQIRQGTQLPAAE
jgi:hypothetical protein